MSKHCWLNNDSVVNILQSGSTLTSVCGYCGHYATERVRWVVCVVTMATVLVYWLYSNWQPASQHQGCRTRSHALWFGHNGKLFYCILCGRRLLCSASWRVSPPWKDCKPAGSPGNISKCRLVYHTQVFKHQVIHVSRMIEPPSWQMSALELLLVCYFRILLVYPCTLYYEMLTRWLQDMGGVSVSSCKMVWKSWWVWARTKKRWYCIAT